MIWTALVPLKQPEARKSRLAGRLSPEARQRLSLLLFERLVAVLRSVPSIGPILPLVEQAPEGWSGDWIRDEGRGLNAELEAARAALGTVPLLVIHADLPLVEPADVAAMLARAEEGGSAIAPDRHGEGTNAVALMAGRVFAFAFGRHSLARHRAMPNDPSVLVERTGLGFDCDTPDDLDRAIAAGFAFPRGD